MTAFHAKPDESKPRVTRRQIERMEAGEIVALNRHQLDDLYEHAPKWVDVYVSKVKRVDGLFDVIIRDTRPDAVPNSLNAEIRRQIAKDMQAYAPKKK